MDLRWTKPKQRPRKNKTKISPDEPKKTQTAKSQQKYSVLDFEEDDHCMLWTLREITMWKNAVKIGTGYHKHKTKCINSVECNGSWLKSWFNFEKKGFNQATGIGDTAVVREKKRNWRWICKMSKKPT